MFSGRWPNSGSMRNGVVSKRPPLGRRTVATDGSVWPTATAGHDARNRTAVRRKPLKETTNHNGETLADAVWNWPTPTNSMETLQDMEQARFSGSGGKRPKYADADWQTPGTDSFRSRGGDRKDEMGLDQQARWMTPRAIYGEHSGMKDASHLMGQASLVTGHQAAQTEPNGSESLEKTPTSPRRLNPVFVCWLMGFPRNWPDVFAENSSVVSATPSYPPRPQPQSVNS